MLKKPSLSEEAYRIEGQPMFIVLDKVKNIIYFEIGDFDF